MSAAEQQVAEATRTDIALLPIPQRVAVALQSSETEKQLLELATKHRDIVAVTNKDGREQAHSAYMVLRNTRVAIEKRAKAAREDATAFSKAVIAEEKRLVGLIDPEETRLQKLRDDWDAEQERIRQEAVERERQRVAAIEARIDEFRMAPAASVGKSAEAIADRLREIEAEPITEAVYQERMDAALAAREEAVTRMRELHAMQLRQEEEAERLRVQREEDEKRRREEEARLAEERERLAAEREAHERREREAREREEQARLEREAEQRKIEDDRRRLAQERAALEVEQYFDAAIASSAQIDDIALLQQKHREVEECPVDEHIHGPWADDLRIRRMDACAAIGSRIQRLHNAELARQRAANPLPTSPAAGQMTAAPSPEGAGPAAATPVADALATYPGDVQMEDAIVLQFGVNRVTAIVWLSNYKTT